MSLAHGRSGWRDRRRDRSGEDAVERGERDRELGAGALLGLHLDASSGVLNDALADREPQSGALLFRRKEGDEQVLQDLLADARPGIRDADLDDLGVVRRK